MYIFANAATSLLFAGKMHLRIYETRQINSFQVRLKNIKAEQPLVKKWTERIIKADFISRDV